jgi:hypothetical protein
MVLGNNGNLFNYFVRVATSSEEQQSQSSSSEATMETPLQHSLGEGLLSTADADVSPTKEKERSMKRKHTFALNFAEDIERQTGLIVPSANAARA